MTKKEQAIRLAVARLVKASGCDCCRDTDEWDKQQVILATLLAIPMYKDGSGYDFYSIANAGIEVK